jgi:hypothetical protein
MGLGRTHTTIRSSVARVHRVVSGDDAFEAVVHLLRRLAQGELAEGDEIVSLEEVRQGSGDLVQVVHDAAFQTVQQSVGGQVDEHYLVCLIEHGVGQRLLHPHSGDLEHGVVQALEVLDIHRRDHADAGGEDLLDALPSLLVGGAGHVGVRHLVDQDPRRTTSDDCGGVELLELLAAVLEALERNLLEALDEFSGLGAAVGLHEADHEVLAA